MVFGNETIAIPDGLITDEFLIRPLSVTDGALDYAAVMESKIILRQWEQSSWPSDDFTPADNFKDLDRHEQEHLRRESFTFTVMNRDETECLGCIYIFPRTARWLAQAETTPLGPAAWSEFEAVVLFWIRASRLAEGMDRRLLDVLRPWLAGTWAFEGHLFQTSALFAQQVAMFEAAGLQRRFEVQLPKHAAREVAYSE
jgi:hypothetical protein